MSETAGVQFNSIQKYSRGFASYVCYLPAYEIFSLN
jgi:hypothetical protein